MHEKKRQRSNYVPESTVVNPSASWVTRTTKRSRNESVEETGTSSKRPFTAKDRDEFLMNGFMEQLEIRVSDDIRECYRANRSLNVIRQNMLSRSQLPRGIVTNAGSRLQLKATEIENFLKEKEKRQHQYKCGKIMWKSSSITLPIELKRKMIAEKRLWNSMSPVLVSQKKCL